MLAALVPPGVVTKMLAVPALPAGVVQVAGVLLTTVNVVQATPPTVIAVVNVKLVPVMVIDEPPAVLPVLELIAVTVGGLTRILSPPSVDA